MAEFSDKMIASLPMYDCFIPDEYSDTFWTYVHREALPIETPEHLNRSLSCHEMWTANKRLVFSQTCGLPLVKKYSSQLRVIGTPVYTAQGCKGSFYSSAIVSSASNTHMSLVDILSSGRIVVAVNSLDSCSGWLMLVAAIAEATRGQDKCFNDIVSKVVITSSHMGSMVAVREGVADLAAVDCVSYALAQRHCPSLTQALKVVGWTPSAPALPFVTQSDAANALVEGLQGGLSSALRDPSLEEARDAMCLRDIDMSGEFDLCAYTDAISALIETASCILKNIDDIISSGREDLINAVTVEHLSNVYDQTWPKTDFQFVSCIKHTLANYLEQHAEDLLSLVGRYVWIPLPDGGSARGVFPSLQGLQYLLQCCRAGELENDPMFVCFMGALRAATTTSPSTEKETNSCNSDHLSHNVSPTFTDKELRDVREKVWAADHELNSILFQQGGDIGIYCVISSPRTGHRGDWGNLVLVKDEDAIRRWHALDQHVYVVGTLSSSYYDHIRIHRGILTGGLRAERVHLKRTIFLGMGTGRSAASADTIDTTFCGHLRWTRNVVEWCPDKESSSCATVSIHSPCAIPGSCGVAVSESTKLLGDDNNVNVCVYTHQ